MEMSIIRLNDANLQTFEELYHDSALTFLGVIPEEAQLYRDFFKQFSDIDESQPCYMYSGRQMNEYYDLTGPHAYPDDLCIISFKQATFKNALGICIPRFQIGGRWFDDIVENNKDHLDEDENC